MNHFHTSRASRRGAALVSALGMLVFLTALGGVYIVYMASEQEDALISIQKSRARHLAEGGIYAAIGEIQAAVRQGQVPEKEYTFEIPLYMNVRGEMTPQSQTVTVQVSDESGLININHVEREVLEALGIARPKARELRNKLPRREIPSMEERYWLSSVQDLRTRGFVTGPEYKNARTDLMTVYTVADPEAPRNFINVNSAPADVLAALFNLTTDEALAAVHKRPFRSWEDLKRKLGKDASTFNVIENAVPNRAMPTEIALASRSFRIVSKVQMTNAFTSRRGMTKGVEAVVLIQDGGGYAFRFWSETPVELTEILMAEGTGEEVMPESPETAEVEDSAGEGEIEDGTPAEGETPAGEETAEGEPVVESAPADSESDPAQAVTEDSDTELTG